MRENTDQKISEYGDFSRSVLVLNSKIMDGISEVTPAGLTEIITVMVNKNSTFENLKNFGISEKKYSSGSEII